MRPPRFPSGCFDWQAWRAGSPADIGLICREAALVEMAIVLRSVAVGWCDGWRVPCRPKVGHKAVMMFHDGRQFWFHLTDREFERIFDAA